MAGSRPEGSGVVSATNLAPCLDFQVAGNQAPLLQLRQRRACPRRISFRNDLATRARLSWQFQGE